MSIHQSSFSKVFFCSVIAAFVGTPGVHATELKDSQKVISETNREAAESQQNIDRLAGESQALLEEYRRIQNGVEYQAAYTRELQQLKRSQEDRIRSLKRQVEEAGVTQQRIVPLMLSMADSLEKFVVLDLPFHQEQRISSVLQLKQRLRQPDIPLSVRFRLLFETWQLEQDYGTTIEAWRGPLELAENSLSVEFLRIGRLALYYQSLDGLHCGYWDRHGQNWVRLDEGHNRAIARALRVAKNQVAPDLLSLPMVPPGAEQ